MRSSSSLRLYSGRGLSILPCTAIASGSPHEVRTLRRKGVLIHYRPGGSDVENIVKKLLKRESEYWLPPQFEPRSILDLGANIGIASIDFALRYPQASILAIEPVAANFQLLQKNISRLPKYSRPECGGGQTR